jgi:hypothetical protein
LLFGGCVELCMEIQNSVISRHLFTSVCWGVGGGMCGWVLADERASLYCVRTIRVEELLPRY